VTATVGIGPNGQGGFALAVHIALEDEQARQLVTVAHQVCPYSNAVRGNIDVQVSVNGLAL
jgi:lipoyl-dependent peroxiredoxin